MLAEINVNNLTDQGRVLVKKTAHRNAVWDRSEPETTKAVFPTLTFVAMPLWNARQQSLPTFTELVQNVHQKVDHSVSFVEYHGAFLPVSGDADCEFNLSFAQLLT